MGGVENARNAVLSIFLMIFAGGAMFAAGWLKDEHLPLLSRLVVKVALPCMIVDNLFSQYTAESLLANVPGIVASFASIAVTMALAVPLGRLLRLPPKRLGVFVAMFSLSNSVFIGVPVSKALFGESVIPYTLLYYIANTTVFWSAGFALMRRWGGATPQARRLPPAPLVVFFVCVGLIFARFSPPAFLLSACGYLGNLVTPLSLLFIGAVMMRMIRARSFRWERGYLAAAVGRFVVSPGLLLAAAALLNVTGIMRDVLMVQAAMPVMSQTALVAASTGSDEEYAAGGTALTTAMSLALIPVYMFLIERVL